jgi:hypothetical protein
MSRRSNAGLRDRWIAAVLASELNNSCKLVCIALSRHMTDEGRVSQIRRETIAADLGLHSLQRITDRIKQAKDAGFLSKTGGGVNATAVSYMAMIPVAQVPRAGVPDDGPGNGSRGTWNGVPAHAQKDGPGTPPRGAIRARVPKNNREYQPAPDGSRAERDHDVTSQAGSYGSWMPTRLNQPSFDSRTEVA